MQGRGRTCCFPFLTLGGDFGAAESRRKEKGRENCWVGPWGAWLPPTGPSGDAEAGQVSKEPPQGAAIGNNP